jgi:hypothetical protein
MRSKQNENASKDYQTERARSDSSKKETKNDKENKN